VTPIPPPSERCHEAYPFREGTLNVRKGCRRPLGHAGQHIGWTEQEDYGPIDLASVVTWPTWSQCPNCHGTGMVCEADNPLAALVGPAPTAGGA
jgi:hypothetical protein